jgi:hypothetical protein
MVRESQRLAVCSGQARTHVEDLRAGIHAGLTELHSSRDFYKEGETAAQQAETLALNIAIEANRLGGDARRIAEMASHLHRKLQAMHAVNRKGQALVQRIERQVEPWAADADQAYHAFDDVRDATHLLGRHIRGTTETLLGQAKLIQSLNQDLGIGVPAPPAAPAKIDDDTETASAPTAHPLEPPALPDPLPPIDDRERSPKLVRKVRVAIHSQRRKIRGRKSA